MNYSIESKNDLFIIRIHNHRATIDFADRLKEELDVYINEKNLALGIIDISKVEFIDSSMLGVLVVGLKWTSMKGGDLKIVGLQPPVRAMFELTKMYKVFEVYETIEDTLASCE